MLFDYTQIDADRVRSEADRAIAAGEALVSKVADPSTPATYEDIIAPLDRVGDLITTAFGRGPFMAYVHPDQEVRAAAREAEEQLSKWGVDLVFREELYAAVKRLAESDAATGLQGERRRLLEFGMRDFRRAGHELDPESRARVRKLTSRLVELGVRFEQNIAEHQDHLLVTRQDLDGLPESYIESLEPGEEEGTYKVTLAYPHVIPFMENARRRDLREQLALKFNTRAMPDNKELLDEAVRIRQEIADIFGLPSWAHHQLEVRMAKLPERVDEFYRDLIDPLTAKGREEIAVMTEMLRADTGDPEAVLQPWDRAYYDTQLRKTRYGVDPQEVAAYFPLHQVLEGMFELTAEMFGLEYRQLEDPAAWHPDVVAYAVHDADRGELIGHFYMDLFPREGKYSHAAAFTLVGGRLLPDGSYQHPVSAIVANFTKPTASRPSLLQHQEVETLFHEFGHILHQVLTRAESSRFSGTNTETDFVEAPSQIMEHWTWRPEVLRRFARHHQTGEPIPEELVDKLVAARRLNVALLTLRQIQFGKLDLELHGPGEGKDIEEITRRAAEIALLPYHEGTFFPASFGHLLGGYDAGYYGYLWSEVYGDDMFSRFEEEGVTNPEVGRAYRREILERGGSLDADAMLRAFLGREPNNQAFLRKLGVIE